MISFLHLFSLLLDEMVVELESANRDIGNDKQQCVQLNPAAAR